jgi:hypothetical protein
MVSLMELYGGLNEDDWDYLAEGNHTLTLKYTG